MRRLTFPGQQQDRSSCYCMLRKGERFSQPFWPLIAYHERDNFLSCLGCVTDWQQETRGLFLWPEYRDILLGSTRNGGHRWPVARSTSGKHTRSSCRWGSPNDRIGDR